MKEKEFRVIAEYVAANSAVGRPCVFGITYEPPAHDLAIGTWRAGIGSSDDGPDHTGTGRTPNDAVTGLVASITADSDDPTTDVGQRHDPRRFGTKVTPITRARSSPAPYTSTDYAYDPAGGVAHEPEPPPADPPPNPWPGFAPRGDNPGPYRGPVTTTRYEPDPDGPDGHVLRTFNPDPANFSPED